MSKTCSWANIKIIPHICTKCDGSGHAPDGYCNCKKGLERQTEHNRRNNPIKRDCNYNVRAVVRQLEDTCVWCRKWIEPNERSVEHIMPACHQKGNNSIKMACKLCNNIRGGLQSLFLDLVHQNNQKNYASALKFQMLKHLNTFIYLINRPENEELVNLWTKLYPSFVDYHPYQAKWLKLLNKHL